MIVDVPHVTHRDTADTEHRRAPTTPASTATRCRSSDGTLVAVHTAETARRRQRRHARAARDRATTSGCKTLRRRRAATASPDQPLTAGITQDRSSYWDPDVLRRPTTARCGSSTRSRCARARVPPCRVPAAAKRPSAQVFAQEGVDAAQLRRATCAAAQPGADRQPQRHHARPRRPPAAVQPARRRAATQTHRRRRARSTTSRTCRSSRATRSAATAAPTTPRAGPPRARAADARRPTVTNPPTRGAPAGQRARSRPTARWRRSCRRAARCRGSSPTRPATPVVRERYWLDLPAGRDPRLRVLPRPQQQGPGERTGAHQPARGAPRLPALLEGDLLRGGGGRRRRGGRGQRGRARHRRVQRLAQPDHHRFRHRALRDGQPNRHAGTDYLAVTGTLTFAPGTYRRARCRCRSSVTLATSRTRRSC